jgi:circadian clock protein KaiB
MRKRVRFKFLLYICGDCPHSTAAVQNLGALCRKHLPECHEIEIVDVLHQPQRALDDGILLTPLLVKLSPAPVVKIVGRLDRLDFVLQALLCRDSQPLPGREVGNQDSPPRETQPVNRKRPRFKVE